MRFFNRNRIDRNRIRGFKTETETDNEVAVVIFDFKNRGHAVAGAVLSKNRTETAFALSYRPLTYYINRRFLV